jgi:hypothetical protein
MTPMRIRLPLVALLLLVALVGAACSGDDGDGTTTTATAGGTVTSTAGSDGSGDAAGGDSGSETDAGDDASNATTTTAASDDGSDEPQIPEYTIVSREPSEQEDEGDTVVVLLDPDSYGLLTDIDLQNVVSEVVDDFPPVYTAYVIDSEDVAELVLMEPAELDAEQQRLVGLHHLVTLEEGFRITFLGAFEESGTVILGS